MTSSYLQHPDYLGNDDYFSPPRSYNNNNNIAEEEGDNNDNASKNKKTKPSSSSSSMMMATAKNRILDYKRLRLFSGDDTVFVVRTNNNEKDISSDANSDGSNSNGSGSSDDEDNDDDDQNNRTLMMLMMIQNQEEEAFQQQNQFSPSSHHHHHHHHNMMSPGIRQQHPQSIWHVSNIVNLHLPGLLWSDPESTGKWQRWLLRAIPEMINLVRLDVRDGQMGDLWCRALMDALIEQKVNAGIKKSSMLESASIFSPRQQRNNQGPAPTAGSSSSLPQTKTKQI